MSGIILCRTGRALKPLVLEEPGVQIYSLEELCYYIYNNIYILTNAFLDEKLIAFIRTEIKEPLLADKLEQLKCENAGLAEAVVTTQRDWGNRTDRKNAKTKYTLERVGVETFKAEVERRAGIKFEPIRPYEFTGRGDRIGWVKGIDDKWHLTLFIENGRILDYPGRPLKTGLLEIAKVHQGEFRITANQNLIVASVPEDQKVRIEKLARDHGLMNAVTPQRENSMACVSFPTCPLAMAEAERFLPSFIDKVEGLMSKHGVSDEHIVTRVTGCPNGCGRAMLAEVGLVGKAPGRYNLHIGGNRNGTRIPRMYRENITESEILDSLDELVGRWAKEREAGEGFGDFTVRAGIIRPVLDPARDLWD